MTEKQTPISPRRIRVGSRNPPKIEAVRVAFRDYFPDIRVTAVEIDSGVPSQPIGWNEILRGARNRARGAFMAGSCDLGVGYEDGLVPVEETRTGHVNFGCCAIFDGADFSLGFSGGFEYPLECSQRAVSTGTPVGDTFDRVFSHATGSALPESGPSSLTIGNIGVLTGEKLTRRDYTRHAVVCALIQLRLPGLYLSKT